MSGLRRVTKPRGYVGDGSDCSIIEAPLKPDCAECSEGVVFSDGAQKRTVYVTTPM